MRAGVVINPAAGLGRINREWPAIEVALRKHLGPLRVEATGQRGDASTIARHLALDGFDLVVAVGGDGTISEAVDGLIQASEAGSMAELAIVPGGTGSDLARALGIVSHPETVAAQIADSRARHLDAGRVCYVDDHGALARRHFVNIASLGVSGPTARAVNAVRRGRRLSGERIFLLLTVRELIRYRFQNVRITVDDEQPIEARIALVGIANGSFFGGGMMIAPDARPDDGLLEVVIVHGRSKLSLLTDLRLVYSGAHRNLDSCTFLRGKRISVEPVDDPLANGALLDIDGESPGRIPATFEILPGAIRLRN